MIEGSYTQDGLTVEYGLETVEGEVIVAKLSVSHPDGLTSRMLSRVSHVETLRHAARAGLLDDIPQPEPQPKRRHSHTKGRKPIDPAVLREIAELRLRLQLEGVPGRNMNQRIGDHLGITRAKATDLLMRATRAGWLAPSRPGAQYRFAGPLLVGAQRQVEQ